MCRKLRVLKFVILLSGLLGLCSCYQMRGDGLNTSPVTNNPNIVPSSSGIGPFTGLHS